LEVLEKGIPGTAMPPWKSQLDEGQRQALADFVRSLYSLPGEN
jgi:mono/diheme cytochrome c family protein